MGQAEKTFLELAAWLGGAANKLEVPTLFTLLHGFVCDMEKAVADNEAADARVRPGGGESCGHIRCCAYKVEPGDRRRCGSSTVLHCCPKP